MTLLCPWAWFLKLAKGEEGVLLQDKMGIPPPLLQPLQPLRPHRSPTFSVNFSRPRLSTMPWSSASWPTLTLAPSWTLPMDFMSRAKSGTIRHVPPSFQSSIMKSLLSLSSQIQRILRIQKILRIHNLPEGGLAVPQTQSHLGHRLQQYRGEQARSIEGKSREFK